MKLSFITDEFTQSFHEAVAFAQEFGLHGLELRSVDDRPIHDFDDDTLNNWKKLLDNAGLEVSNLAGSFFKCDPNPEAISAELKKLERLCQIADILGCSTIRGFTFFRDGDTPATAETLAPYYDSAKQILRRYGKQLVLEADPSVNTSNHASVAALLELLDKDCFAAVYDPGNCLYDPFGEEPFPAGYKAILPHLKHVHIKDVILTENGPLCLAPGQGLVGFRPLLAQLKADGYDGWLSLEPHYRKNQVLTEEQMRTPAGSNFSSGGYEAMAESALALKAMLKEINWI